MSNPCEWEALMIGPNGESLVASAWGATLEEAANMAERGVVDLPGWSVVLSGSLRSHT